MISDIRMKYNQEKGGVDITITLKDSERIQQSFTHTNPKMDGTTIVPPSKANISVLADFFSLASALKG